MAAVPEPSAFAILGVASICLIAYARRWRKASLGNCERHDREAHGYQL